MSGLAIGPRVRAGGLLLLALLAMGGALTSDWVHELIPHSQLRDPPWPDDEWNQRMAAVAAGRATGLFIGWPMLADGIVEFTRQ